MKPAMWLVACVAAFALAATGCDDGETPPDNTGIDWANATQAEKTQYMTSTVEPTMRPLFQEHDSARFSSFSCVTCHGTTGTFTMPNPALPKIDLAAFPVKGDSAIVDFMYDTVTPKVSELLGIAMRTTPEGEGIGCLTCHEKQ